MEHIKINSCNTLTSRGVVDMLIMSSSNLCTTIEYASRQCYNSLDKMKPYSWYRYIRARVNDGHCSVIEHSNIAMICTCTDEFADAVKKSLALTNSMLHYVEDRVIKWSDGLVMVSLSGNIRMWRDFFINMKGITNSDAINDVTLVYGSMFRFWDYLTTRELTDKMVADGYMTDSNYEMIRELFTSDIEQIRMFSGTNIVKNIEDYNFSSNLPGWKHELKTEVLRDGADDGITVYGINADDPVCISGDHYYRTFLSKYKKDISSVTIVYTMPRIITQMEARHRINAISQKSQRYVSERNGTIYVPETIDGDKKYNVNGLSLSYNDVNNIIMGMYQALQDDGIKNEDARFILPNAVYSTLVVTKPLYTINHYYNERSSKAAQREIRYVAEALKKYVNDKDTMYKSYYKENIIK